MMHEESKGLSRRTFLRMSGMFAGAAVLAACAAAPVAAPAGEQAAAEAPAAEAGSLEMYTRLTNNEQLDMLSTKYAEEHNGAQLTVSAFEGRDMLTKLTTAIAGGLPPDLVMLDIAFTAQFADRDVLMDIGQIVTDTGMKEDAFKGYDVGTTWKGKYISYPMWSDCSALYFNKKLMTDAGVTSMEGPKSWQDIQDQATAIHGLGDDIWGFLTNVTSSGATWFLWAPFMWAAGGETFNADMTGTEFDSPPALGAAKLWVDMYNAGLSPIESVSGTWGDVEGLFTSGKSGMLLSGPYMVGLNGRPVPRGRIWHYANSWPRDWPDFVLCRRRRYEHHRSDQAERCSHRSLQVDHRCQVDERYCSREQRHLDQWLAPAQFSRRCRIPGKIP